MKNAETYQDEERRRDKARKRSFVLSEACGITAGIAAGIILIVVMLSLAYALAQHFGFSSLAFGTSVIVAALVTIIVILNIVHQVVRKRWPTKTESDRGQRDDYP